MTGFGEINISTPAAAQLVTSAAPQVLIGFANNGPQASGDASVVPDQANNRIRVEKGTFQVAFAASLAIGGAGAAGDLIFQLGKNGAAQGKLTGKVTATTTASKAHVSFEGLLPIVDADLSEVNLPNQPSWDPRFPTGMNVALLNVLVSSSVAAPGISMTVEAATLVVSKVE